jgi:hypothetical protein
MIKMSIYENPTQYAEKNSIPLELAEKWCEDMLKIDNKINLLKVCPICNQPTLEYESGSYEESISDYIYCENDKILMIDENGEECETECAFTSNIVGEYSLLQPDINFDVIRWFGMSPKERLQEFGDNEKWLEFARKTIEKESLL